VKGWRKLRFLDSRIIADADVSCRFFFVREGVARAGSAAEQVRFAEKATKRRHAKSPDMEETREYP
jgi:hypothetical protein